MTLTAEQFLQAIEHDTAALAAAAGNGMDAPVPSCPDWTTRDLVLHTGQVHRNKELVVRERRTTDELDADLPEDNIIEWFEEGSRLLIQTLRSVDPATETWTWHKPDQTAGF